MNIDRNKVYEVDGYSFHNFVTLDKDYIEMVRVWRNNPEIRNMMYHRDIISPEQHIEFVNRLNNKDNCFYWLVKFNDKPVGVMSIVDLDLDNNQGELGYYLAPDNIGSGEGLQFIMAINYFLFNIVGLKNIKGHTDIENKNALMINKYIGNEFHSEIVSICGKKYIEMHCNARSFSEAYKKKDDIKSLVRFRKQFKEYFDNTYGNK